MYLRRMACRLATARLVLTPLGPADADVLHALWTGEEVRRHLWDGEVIPASQTAEILAENGRLFAERGFGLWGVRRPDAPELLGFAGFWHFRDPPERELLYGLDPTAWGRGYATECARALLRFGFEELGFESITGSTDAGNTASPGVMERAGMAFLRREVTGGLDTMYYTLARERFQPGPEPYRIEAAAPGSPEEDGSTAGETLLGRGAGDLLDLFAQPLASPAAGSAAALAGALAAALVGKVAQLSATPGQKAQLSALPSQAALPSAPGGFADRAGEIAAAAERLRALLQAEVEADPPVFAEVMRRRAERDAAQSSAGPDTPGASADRAELARRAVEALQPAIEGPLRVARAALEVGRLAAELRDRGRRSARGDAGTALALARAAAGSALLLVAENLRPARSAAWSAGLQAEADTLLVDLAELEEAAGPPGDG